MTVEAMKQALEALEAAHDLSLDGDHYAARVVLKDGAEGVRDAITKAEEARWYSVDQMGMATLCRDEDDAAETASENNLMWPRHAPHLATRLVAIDSAIAAQEAGKGSAVTTQGAHT